MTDHVSKSEVLSLISEIGFERVRRKYKSKFSEFKNKFWDIPEFEPEKISEILYYMVSGIKPDTCLNGNKLGYVNNSVGYKKSCNDSENCGCLRTTRRKQLISTWENKSEEEIREITEKRNNTCIEKYGTTNVADYFSDKISEKLQNKSEEEIKEIVKKRNDTCMERYGVPNPLQSDIVKDKSKKTNIERYGVPNPLQSDIVKDKSKKTNIERYGFDHPMKSYIVKNKVSETKISRYGNSNSFGNDLPEHVKEILHDKNKLIELVKNNISMEVINLLEINASYFYSIIKKYDIELLKNRISSGQNEIMKFLDLYDISYKVSSKNIISPLEIDIYVKEHNLAIEYNGLYWHTEEKGRGKNYHKTKFVECDILGITLIQINDIDWIHKKDIIKSLILHNLDLLSSPQYTKLIIGEVIQNDVEIFLNDNHILGYSENITISYGMYYDNDLVAIMSFSKTDIWNLERISFKNNIKIDFNLIFKKFLNEIDPESILCNCDLRYFNGKIPKELGFRFYENRNPECHYFRNDAIHEDICPEKQYSKVWDCGYNVYIWEKENS